MSGPRVSSGSKSRQDFSTPADFMAAVKKRFGRLSVDLAAHSRNAKCERWLGRGGMHPDSLDFDWCTLGGLLWLNPPFTKIEPWAEKCAASTYRSNILFLVPASVGSNWFRHHVAPFSDVYFLNGRLSFDGKNPYPKDCLLAHFHNARPMVQIWDWRDDEICAWWGV